MSRNGFLVPLIREVSSRVNDYFGSVPFFLERFLDPDSPDDGKLVVSILSDLDPDAADAALERFDEEWWLDNLPRADGKLCVTLEIR